MEIDFRSLKVYGAMFGCGAKLECFSDFRLFSACLLQ